MAWSVVGFGKHKGKSLPQIILNDPDWFFWALDANIFDTDLRLKQEAEEIDCKWEIPRVRLLRLDFVSQCEFPRWLTEIGPPGN